MPSPFTCRRLFVYITVIPPFSAPANTTKQQLSNAVEIPSSNDACAADRWYHGFQTSMAMRQSSFRGSGSALSRYKSHGLLLPKSTSWRFFSSSLYIFITAQETSHHANFHLTLLIWLRVTWLYHWFCCLCIRILLSRQLHSTRSSTLSTKHTSFRFFQTQIMLGVQENKSRGSRYISVMVE